MSITTPPSIFRGAPCRLWLWRILAAPLLVLSLAALLPAHYHGPFDFDGDGAASGRPGPHPDHSPLDDSHDHGGCVICHLAHFLGVLPQLDGDLACAAPALEIQQVPADVVVALDYPQTCLGRGPPRA